MNVENFITRKRARHVPNAKTVGLLALLFAVAASAPAQTTPPAPAELRKLDFLVGEWKGKGWMFDARGGRAAEMSQSVKVRRADDGSSLRVKDVRTMKTPNVAPGGSPSYSSAPTDATVYYDDAAGLFRWRRDKDRRNPSELKIIGPQTVRWEQRSETMALRVTVRVTEAGEWHETLEFWSNQHGWLIAFESVLRRTK